AVTHPRRRRWWAVLRRAIPLITLLGVTALVLKMYVFKASEIDCITASRTLSPGNAVLICQHEYQETKSPRTGAFLADVLRRSGNLTAASALANDLLSTEVNGDANQILGKVAVAQNRVDDAITYLQHARVAHRMQNDHTELARDAQSLAEIQSKA